MVTQGERENQRISIRTKLEFLKPFDLIITTNIMQSDEGGRDTGKEVPAGSA